MAKLLILKHGALIIDHPVFILNLGRSSLFGLVDTLDRIEN